MTSNLPGYRVVQSHYLSAEKHEFKPVKLPSKTTCLFEAGAGEMQATEIEANGLRGYVGFVRVLSFFRSGLFFFGSMTKKIAMVRGIQKVRGSSSSKKGQTENFLGLNLLCPGKTPQNITEKLTSKCCCGIVDACVCESVKKAAAFRPARHRWCTRLAPPPTHQPSVEAEE